MSTEEKTFLDELKSFIDELDSTIDTGSEESEYTQETEAEQQRKDKWYKDRAGVFTGSSIKKLMTCMSKKKGKDWEDAFWLMNFGDTAIAYIYEKATERDTGNPLDNANNFKSYQMERGTALEGQTVYNVCEKLNANYKPMPFVKFMANAGASPDGEVTISDIGVLAFEGKCPDTVSNHYRYGRELIDENHEYFWQLMAEILAVDTDKALFVSYDPRVAEDVQLFSQIVEKSEIHCFALIFRLTVAEIILRELIRSRFSADPYTIIENINKNIPAQYQDIKDWTTKKIKELKL